MGSVAVGYGVFIDDYHPALLLTKIKEILGSIPSSPFLHSANDDEDDHVTDASRRDVVPGKRSESKKIFISSSISRESKEFIDLMNGQSGDKKINMKDFVITDSVAEAGVVVVVFENVHLHAAVSAAKDDFIAAIRYNIPIIPIKVASRAGSTSATTAPPSTWFHLGMAGMLYYTLPAGEDAYKPFDFVQDSSPMNEVVVGVFDALHGTKTSLIKHEKERIKLLLSSREIQEQRKKHPAPSPDELVPKLESNLQFNSTSYTVTRLSTATATAIPSFTSLSLFQAHHFDCFLSYNWSSSRHLVRKVYENLNIRNVKGYDIISCYIYILFFLYWFVDVDE